MLGVAAIFDAHQIAAMTAAIAEDMDRAVLVPDHDHRGVADIAGDVVAAVRHLALDADKAPDRPAENPLLFLGINIWVGIDPVGNLMDALTGPVDQLSQIVGCHCAHG